MRFHDYPEFRPNLTPRQIFRLGSFGGTYWRPIKSSVTGKAHRNAHRTLPSDWWKGVPESHLSSDEYDVSVNRYGVKVGSTLTEWESKGWIVASDPYGWVQWYCRFYNGRRSTDDERQIRRWQRLAGPQGRFRRRLIRLIKQEKKEWNDALVSPKIRQTLQHWGYRLTKKDYDISQ